MPFKVTFSKKANESQHKMPLEATRKVRLRTAIKAQKSAQEPVQLYVLYNEENESSNQHAASSVHQQRAPPGPCNPLGLWTAVSSVYTRARAFHVPSPPPAPQRLRVRVVRRAADNG